MKKWLLGAIIAFTVIVGFSGVSFTQSADPLPPEHSRA
ncbi:hypothetical protein JOC85_003323 [Bacillus mesophilus]|nr:hypothetical protein [Bacillus mesophilus]